MRRIFSSGLTACCLLAVAAQATAADPPAGSARGWNIQIQPGPTAPHSSTASPLVSDGPISRDPIMSGEEPRDSRSLSESLGRGGRFYLGRGNRLANSANGASSTNGIGGKNTTGSTPSLKGNPPRPIVSKPSRPTNHPRPPHAAGQGSGGHGSGHMGGSGGRSGGGHRGGGHGSGRGKH